MFDTAAATPLTLSGATLITPEGPVEAALRVEAGRIAGLSASRGEGVDLSGHILIPGVVDLHTDHVEAHVYPRNTVQWPFLPALMAHDAVVIAGGTTTVFDSLSVGASMKRPERREILAPLVDALENGRRLGMFRADHLLHLRCEISDPETKGLVDATIGRDIARLVSVMDHTPGDRQSVDTEKWFTHMIREMEIDAEEGRPRRGRGARSCRRRRLQATRTPRDHTPRSKGTSSSSPKRTTSARIPSASRPLSSSPAAVAGAALTVAIASGIDPQSRPSLTAP